MTSSSRFGIFDPLVNTKFTQLPVLWSESESPPELMSQNLDFEKSYRARLTLFL